MNITLEEEVMRKGLNALAMVQSDMDNKRISSETYKYVTKVLHEAFAGISGDDFMTLLDDMIKSCQEKRVRLFKNDKVLFVVVRENENTVHVDENGEIVILWNCDDAEQLKIKTKLIIRKLIEDKGYKLG